MAKPSNEDNCPQGSDKTSEEIYEYLNDSDINSAIMLTGDWGVGKTHYINNELSNQLKKHFDNDVSRYNEKSTDVSITLCSKLKEKHKYGIALIRHPINSYRKYRKSKIIKFSCFGVTSADDFYDKLLGAAFAPADTRSINEVHFNLLNKIFNIVNSVLKWANKFRFIGIPIPSINLDPRVYAPIALHWFKGLIVIDDLERCRCHPSDLLGEINNLVENRGKKVLIIANNKKVEKSKVEEHNYDKDDSTQSSQKATASKDKNGTPNSSQEPNIDKLCTSLHDIQVALTVPNQFSYEELNEKVVSKTLRYTPSVEEQLNIIGAWKQAQSISDLKPEIIDNLEKAYKTHGIKRSMNLRALKKSEKLIEVVLRTDFVQNRNPKLDTAGVIADVILLCELTASGNAPCAPAPESPDKELLHKLTKPIGLYNKPTNETLYDKYETLKCVHSLKPTNPPEEYNDDYINAQLYAYQKEYFPFTPLGIEARNILENLAELYQLSDDDNQKNLNKLCKAARDNALGFSGLSEILATIKVVFIDTFDFKLENNRDFSAFAHEVIENNIRQYYEDACVYESSQDKKKIGEEKKEINSKIEKGEITNKYDITLELLSEINIQQANKLPSKISGFFKKDTGNGIEIIQINNLIDMNSTNQNTIIFNSLLSELVNYCDRAENDGVFQLRSLLCNLIPEQDTKFIKEQLNQEELGKVVCQLKELIDQPINKEEPKVKQFNLKDLFNFLVDLEKEPRFKQYDDIPRPFHRRLNKQ